MEGLKEVKFFWGLLILALVTAGIVHFIYWQNRAPKDGKYFIDINGNIVSEAHDDITSFREGVAKCYDGGYFFSHEISLINKLVSPFAHLSLLSKVSICI